MPQYTALITTLSMILNVILNYFLIQIAGIEGAAIATFVSRTFAIILTVYLLYKILKLSVPVGVTLKPALCALAMLFLLIIFPDLRNLLVGVIEIVVAIAFYTIILFAIRGITSEDVVYFLRAFGLKK